MFARFRHLIAILAAIQILGGHWIALQSVAWVEMVIDYSKQSSVGAALEKTFDGAHPCTLCKNVAKGRGEEQKQRSEKQLTHFEAVLMDGAGLPARVVAEWKYCPCNGVLLERVVAPPTPPPLA